MYWGAIILLLLWFLMVVKRPYDSYGSVQMKNKFKPGRKPFPPPAPPRKRD